MIIGLTGSLCAGKGVVSGFLKKQGFVYLSLSDELRQIAREKSIELTRDNLQALGNQLRLEQGAGVLGKLVSKKVLDQEYSKASVDGIRNPAEVEVLRGLEDFCLVSVDAPAEVRFKRMIARNRENDPKTFEEFLRVDAKDKGEGEREDGQQVGRCMKMANYTLINDGDLPLIESRVQEIYDQIDSQFRPAWDKYFIGIMEAVSKRATCNRGKSGCVITIDNKIVATGYVGAPKGQKHCSEVGHLFEVVEHADGRKTKHCVRTVHAEQNAICQAAELGRSVKGATLYCRMTPCAKICAPMIVNSGIVRVVAQRRYHDSERSEQMLAEAGVKLNYLSGETQQYAGQKVGDKK